MQDAPETPYTRQACNTCQPVIEIRGPGVARNDGGNEGSRVILQQLGNDFQFRRTIRGDNIHLEIDRTKVLDRGKRRQVFPGRHRPVQDRHTLQPGDVEPGWVPDMHMAVDNRLHHGNPLLVSP